jgi:tungstate transport system substrate-binding protein
MSSQAITAAESETASLPAAVPEGSQDISVLVGGGAVWKVVAGIGLLGATMAAPAGSTPSAAQQTDLVLATTTSVRDAGLLEAIIPPFERQTGYRVKVIAVGSGQAMELGRRGEADILVLHDPVGEERFVREGYGIVRQPLMHNQFVVVGPAEDPAGVRSVTTAAAALAAVAGSRARFISRGDRSGTHVKEQALWSAAGIEPDGVWHLESGQGMSATIQIANELRAYTLTDLGTFLSHKAPLDLEVLLEGDSALFNPYHVVLPNPERFPWINASGGRSLLDYVLSSEAQSVIGAFGRDRFGRPLFVPSVVVDVREKT